MARRGRNGGRHERRDQQGQEETGEHRALISRPDVTRHLLHQQPGHIATIQRPIASPLDDLRSKRRDALRKSRVSGTRAWRGHWAMMRASILATLLSLAACTSEPAANNAPETSNAAAAAPRLTGPAPKAPVTDVTPAPGESPSWMGARSAPDAPQSAPYADLLDQPVVNGAAAR